MISLWIGDLFCQKVNMLREQANMYSKTYEKVLYQEKNNHHKRVDSNRRKLINIVLG